MFLIQVARGGAEIRISGKLPGDAAAAGWEPHFEPHRLALSGQ